MSTPQEVTTVQSTPQEVASVQSTPQEVDAVQSTPQEVATMQPVTTPTHVTEATSSATADVSASTTTPAAATTSLYQSYQSQVENLKKLPVPYSDIYHSLSSYDTIPLKTIHERFNSASTDLTTWLESAEMAVFALEMDVGQEGATDKRDVGEMDVILNRFQPNIDMLVELKEKIESRLGSISAAEREEVSAQQMEQDLQQTAQNIKSSWGSLKQMLEKVKGDLAGARLRAELMTHMDNVLVDIEDVCVSIDAYNNERSAITSDEEGFLPSRGGSSEAEAQAKQRSLETLAHVDSRIELLIARVDFLDNRVGSLPTDEASIGNESKDALQSRYQQVQCRWDDLKFRRERVSEELKDDKWLEAFEQVAEQVESMMDSIERAVVHCQGLLDHIKSMARQRVVPDAPIDREHLYSIFKSFEAKHKYYTPAVNQMLEMLENGIESRTTRNMDVVSRHQAMNLKWDQLEDGIERVDIELDGVERLLDFLDDLRTPYLPQLPLKKPEAQANVAKRAQMANPKPGWNTSSTPTLAQKKQQQQQQQKQQQQAKQQTQRGRPTSVRSPVPSYGRTRTPSPTDGYYDYRPWSPANSNSGLSQSGLLTASALNNYRSLSPSPTRGGNRLRPWCPSVSLSSPGIPGIPQVLSTAATFLPRPVSSMGQNYVESPVPTGRATSSMSGAYRSAASSPSMLRTPNQTKPVFSPSGSNSKLSNGVAPASAGPSNGRKTNLPMPSSRSSQTNQRSALSPPPQQQRSQYGREAASPIPSNYANGSHRAPTTTMSASGRPRQHSASGNIQDHYGYEGRSSPASTTSRQSYQGGYYEEREHRAYGSRPSSRPGSRPNSRPGSASGSHSGFGSSYHFTPYEEPTSPSVSSVSSISSTMRQQQHYYGRDQGMPELMDRMNIQLEDVEPYIAVRGDELDEEFAKVVNSSPIQIQIRRLGQGKYYFGGRLDKQGNALTGGKTVLCRLMEYGRVTEDDSVSSGESHSGTDDGLHPQPAHSRGPGMPRRNAGSLAALQADDAAKKRPRKVLVRVGGGWQDLDIFLLDHSNLATENARGY
ncbi:hypothetical protein BGZ58_010390 [Dissophora ornata]|nr:hypothetical protein BGZ58_010390 [Dissophora ornata]